MSGTPVRDALSIGSAAMAAAVAAWLVRASVQIVAWPPSGPERVAYFAPLAQLVTLLLAFAAAAALAIVAARRSHGATVSAIAFPLQWLWLWTVPYWPILPDRFPLLLVLAGRARWAVGAAVAFAIAARLARVHEWRWHLPAAGARTVFAVSLAIYLAAGVAWNAAVGLSGDEPHYLVIAHSLLVDHDLDIENNHARRDYARFFPGDLRPDYLARGRHGEIYSVHAPGLPALLLPGYAAGGARGAVVEMSLIAALAALAIFEIGLLLGGRRAAWLTWAGGCLTVPFLPHAWLLYPEMAAAAVVAWTTKWLIDRDRSGAPAWIGRGALLALLPWLHTKYVVLLAPLAIVGAVRLMRRPRAAAMFGAPIALSLAAWFGSFFVMYGVFDPQAAYGTYAAAFVRAANIPRGLAGLAIDQKFGLLTFAPVYLLMLVGAWRARRDRWHLAIAATAIVTIVLFAASTTRLYMWWGGASAPARFLVPVVPLFAVLLALAAGAVPRAWTVALGLSLAVSAVTVTAPSEQRLLSDPHGKSRLLDWVQGSAPLTEAWPTFTDPGSRTRITRAFQALVGRFDSSARDAVIRRGRERLLACYDDRLRAFDYASRRRADAAFVLARGSLTARRDAGEITGDPERLAGPFALAAGDYVVRVWFAGEAAPAFVHYHRGPALARAVPDGPGTSVQMPLVLPVDTPVVWVGVNDPAAAARVVAVDVVPQHLVARHSRVAIDPIAIDPIEGGGLIVYADRRSYPEGGVFWTRGRDAAEIYVAPGRATHVRLTLHVGPNAGTVAVTAGEERREVTLPAEGTTEISFPTDGSGRLLPFTVEASDSFVPAVTDPKSGDTRALGCQVRIQLS